MRFNKKAILKKLTPKQSTFRAWANSTGIKALIFGDYYQLLLSGSDVFPIVSVGLEKHGLTPAFAGDPLSLTILPKNTQFCDFLISSGTSELAKAA